MIRASGAGRSAPAGLVGRALDSGTRIRLPTREEFRAGLEAFVRWWAAELWACLPERWQNRLRHRTLHFLVTLQNDKKQVTVLERNNARPRSVFELVWGDDME